MYLVVGQRQICYTDGTKIIISRADGRRYPSGGGAMNLEETLYRIHHEKLYYCDNEELMKENGLYHRLVDLQTASANWKLSV